MRESFMKRIFVLLFLLCSLLVGCSDSGDDIQTPYISLNGDITDISPFIQVSSNKSSGSYWDNTISYFPEISAVSNDEISIELHFSFSIDAVRKYEIANSNLPIGSNSSEYTELLSQQNESMLSFNIGELDSEYQLIRCTLTRPSYSDDEKIDIVFVVKTTNELSLKTDA